MSKEGCLAAKVDTLTELCEETNKLLTQAIDVSYNLVGTLVREDKEVSKEPTCALEVLQDKLKTTNSKAQLLLDQLNNIAIKI